MADNTLRSFLVKLGFDVDKKSQKDFEGSVSTATTHVKELSAAVSAAVVAVGAGATKMAYSLNQLHFESRRTHSSARHLKAFSYAANQLGSSSQQAQGAVEGLASKLRQQPGTENLLNRIGVQTRDAHGHLRGATSMLKQFGNQAEQMRKNGKQYKAEAYAQELGIPEHLLLALERGKFQKYMHQFDRSTKNVNWQEATHKSHQLVVQINKLSTQFQALAVQAEASLEKSVGPALKQFGNWIQKNGPKIAKVIGHWGKEIVDVGQDAVKWFHKINKATDGWLGTLTEITAALTTLKKMPGLGTIIGMGALGSKKILGKLFGFGGGSAAAGGAGGDAAAAGADAGLGGALLGGSVLTGAAAAMYPGKISGSTLGPDKPGQGHQAGEKWIQQHGGSGKKNREHLVKKFLQQQTNFSKSGRAGILANFKKESDFNPHAVGDNGKAYGIGQWHPARQKKFKQLFGHSIKKSNIFEQMMFMRDELRSGKYSNLRSTLKHHGHGYNAGYDFSKKYERPAGGRDEAAERARSAQHIYHTTTIHVHGVSNPNEVAHKVKQAQNDQNQAAVRNNRAPAK